MFGLLAELAERGLTLEVVRPECVFFGRGGRAEYAWPCAISSVQSESSRRVRQQMADWYLTPLYLCALGRSRTLRDLLVRGDLGAPSRAFPEVAEAARLECELERPTATEIYRRLAGQAAAIRLPLADTFWSYYYRWDLPVERTEPWPYKNHAVAQILGSIEPRSVLDLACNAGWYARLAARSGASVVAIDCDETCISRLFDAAAEGDLSVTAAVCDIYSPMALPDPVSGQRIGAEERFASELTLALAITHHMVLSSPWLSFDDVAQILAEYSAHYLLTEFVSFEPESNNPYRPEDRPGCDAWYNLDGFISALKRKFSDVVLVPGPSGRKLLLAEK